MKGRLFLLRLAQDGNTILHSHGFQLSVEEVVGVHNNLVWTIVCTVKATGTIGHKIEGGLTVLLILTISQELIDIDEKRVSR